MLGATGFGRAQSGRAGKAAGRSKKIRPQPMEGMTNGKCKGAGEGGGHEVSADIFTSALALTKRPCRRVASGANNCNSRRAAAPARRRARYAHGNNMRKGRSRAGGPKYLAKTVAYLAHFASQPVDNWDNREGASASSPAGCKCGFVRNWRSRFASAKVTSPDHLADTSRKGALWGRLRATGGGPLAVNRFSVHRVYVRVQEFKPAINLYAERPHGTSPASPTPAANFPLVRARFVLDLRKSAAETCLTLAQ